MGSEKSSSTFHHRMRIGGPLALWLTAQLLILLVPVGQVKLADQFPRPVESMALHELLGAQVVLLALLFPYLLRTAASAAAVAASAWPFLLLAGVLASTPGERIAGCAGYVTLWIAALAAWRNVLRSRVLQMVGVALAATAALGMPLLEYLSSDFSRREDAFIGRWNPHVAWMEILEGRAASAWMWGPPVALMVIALAIRVGARAWRGGRGAAASDQSTVSS